MSDKPADKPTTLPFTYIKSNFFRVIHADGVLVGAGPGHLFFSLYSERVPIPQVQEFEVVDQKIGAEAVDKRVVKPGVVREVEVGVAMSFETAKALKDLLDKQIALLEQAFEKQQQEK
jgi:hypothetical protein